jgi:hypothetical protein
VYDQVGAGADEGADAAENRDVAERDEQLRGADPSLLAPVVHDRDEHRHERCVVDERADRPDGQPHAYLGFGHASWPAEQRLSQQPHPSGLRERSGEDVQHGDGQDTFVAEGPREIPYCRKAR